MVGLKETTHSWWWTSHQQEASKCSNPAQLVAKHRTDPLKSDIQQVASSACPFQKDTYRLLTRWTCEVNLKDGGSISSRGGRAAQSGSISTAFAFESSICAFLGCLLFQKWILHPGQYKPHLTMSVPSPANCYQPVITGWFCPLGGKKALQKLNNVPFYILLWLEPAYYNRL